MIKPSSEVSGKAGEPHYAVAEAARLFGRGGPNHHELRSLAMNWADSLAVETGLEVTLGELTRVDVHVVHHVFRPDGSRQRLAVGRRLPLHASALGKALLAFATGGVRCLKGADLAAYTHSTIRTPQSLADTLSEVRRHGLATEDGELAVDRGAIAAPVHGTDGLAVAAVAISGGRDELFDGHGQAHAELADATRRTAKALTREVHRLW